LADELRHTRASELRLGVGVHTGSVVLGPLSPDAPPNVAVPPSPSSWPSAYRRWPQREPSTSVRRCGSRPGAFFASRRGESVPCQRRPSPCTCTLALGRSRGCRG
jgi:hypothetical protein